MKDGFANITNEIVLYQPNEDLGKKWFAFCKMNINAEEIISRI